MRNKSRHKYDIHGNKYWNLIKNGEHYSHIRYQLRTFDMIFFRGQELISSIISYTQKKIHGKGACLFTHVGMVICARDLPVYSPLYHPSKIYIFESTQSGSVGDGSYNLNNRSKLGVQLRDLDSVAETYDSNPKSLMAWAPLIDGYRPLMDTKTSEKLLSIIRKYNGIRYDCSIIDLASAMFKIFRPIRYIARKIRKYCNDWQFCSELCCNILREFDIISKDINPENVLPCDFLENPLNRGKTFDKDNQIPLIYYKPQIFTTHCDIVNSSSVVM